MLLECFLDSKEERAFDAVIAALDAEQFLANTAHRILVFSTHPRANAVALGRAREWLERTTQHPEHLPQGDDSESIRCISVLEQRGDAECRAMLGEIWSRFYALRKRIPRGSERVPTMAARSYLECSIRGLDAKTMAEIRSAIPNVRATLDDWGKTIALVDAAVVTAGR